MPLLAASAERARGGKPFQPARSVSFEGDEGTNLVAEEH